MPDWPDIDFFQLQQALAGRYSLERELGRGGMGIVYLGREVSLDRPVALKLLPPRLAVQPSARERFLHEARTAAKLSHPNIVPIYAVDEVSEFVFFAMAYIDGETLGQRIRARGPRPPSEAVRVLREVAWALAYAHSQGIVHRDVKPDNILLEAGSGRALVADFGIAGAVRRGDAGDEPTRVKGTAEFMSPEQARGEPVGPASDLYSLGVVGFYALSGQFPFKGSTPAVILAKHISEPPPPLPSVAPEVPGALARLIDGCMVKDPKARAAHGERLAESLGQALGERREIPVPLRVFVKRHSEFSVGTGAVALVTLVLAASVAGGLAPAGFGDIAGWSTIAAGLTVVPAGIAAWRARKLLKAGFDRDELVLAFQDELERSREEGAFMYGEKASLLERILRAASALGFGTAGASLLAKALVWSNPSGALIATFGISLVVGAGAGLLALSRLQDRRDINKQFRIWFWKTRLGHWFFRVAGTGLERTPALDASGYRPTELAIGMAADRLYEDLPRELRRELCGLPDVVRRLESDARTMRRRIEALSELLPQIRSERPESRALEGAVLPAGGGGGSGNVLAGRARLERELLEARDASEARLAEIVAALESIRLGLLRMHAGTVDVEGLTGNLEAARGVASDVERLLEAQSEVEEMLRDK